MFKISGNPIEKKRQKFVLKFKERKCDVRKKDVLQDQRKDPKKNRAGWI